MKRQWAFVGVLSGGVVVLAVVAVFVSMLVFGSRNSPELSAGSSATVVPAATPLTTSSSVATPAADAPPTTSEDWITAELQKFVDAYAAAEPDVSAWIVGLDSRVDDGLKASLWTVDRDLTRASEGRVKSLAMRDESVGQAYVHGDTYEYILSFSVAWYEEESTSEGAWLAVSSIDYTTPPQNVPLPLPSPLLGNGGQLAEVLQRAYSLTFAQSGGLDDEEREALIRQGFVAPERALDIERVAGPEVAIRVSPIDAKTVQFFDAGQGRLGAIVQFTYFPDGMADTQSEYGELTVYLSRQEDGRWQLMDAEETAR